MKKFISAGFFVLALFASVSSVSASGLTESQITAIISLLTSFGTDTYTINDVNAALRGQSSSNTSVSQTSFTWGNATISIPSDWTTSVLQNDADIYTAQLKKNGGLIAKIGKGAGPSPSDSDAMYYDLTHTKVIPSSGISVDKFIGNCKSQYCATEPVSEIIYAFGMPGDSKNYSVRVLVASAGGYFDKLYQAQETMDPIILSLRSAQSSSSATGTQCAAFTRDFSLGATDATTGGEVSRLQKFLYGWAMYPDGSMADYVTGYFGPATSRALQGWQIKHGISITTPGVGVFGPKTRATMSCDGQIQSTTAATPTFSASTVSGPAPLSVTFTTNVAGVSYYLDFGNGSTAWIGNGPNAASAGSCIPSNTGACTYSTTYTYPTTGIFTAKLMSGGYPLSAATITVGASATTATIDQTSVSSSYNAFNLTGSATKSTSVFVVLVKSDYGGSKDWSTIYTTHAYVAHTGGTIIPVNNGRWSAMFSGVSGGTYTALVFDNTTGQQLLASGSLVVSAPSTFNYVAGSGLPITLGVGQSATDDALQITLLSVSYSNDLTGTATANFRVDIKGFSSSYYTVNVNNSIPNSGGLTDTASPTGGASVALFAISIPMNTATILINTAAKGL
jgi:hypothetical protein